MKKYLFILSYVVTGSNLSAQLCQNPTDTVYGLIAVATPGTPGQIVGINVNDAGTTIIGSPAASAVAANGMGFGQIDGRFYFFNQTGSGTTEFVSYDPLTSSKMPLANPPLLPTSQKIRSGTVNRVGTGYYMIYPGATTAQGFPLTAPALFYYSIPLNTWTLITQTFLNSSGTSIANISTLNSGDMTFDGNDDLWMLCSNSTNHALYRIQAPLPTTAVASILVDTMIAQRANPVAAVSFTGIAFNAAGRLYLSTGSGAGPGNNKLYELPSVTSSFTLVGTLPNSYGDDLTSCVFPVGVLPIKWISFTANSINNDAVQLHWVVEEEDAGSKYIVEQSGNAVQWRQVAMIQGNSFSTGQNSYDYITAELNKEKTYYRVTWISGSGKRSISTIRLINTGKSNAISVGPNPATDVIYIYNKEANSKWLALIYDMRGSLISSIPVSANQQLINIQHLNKGSYILKIISPYQNSAISEFKFIKW